MSPPTPSQDAFARLVVAARALAAAELEPVRHGRAELERRLAVLAFAALDYADTKRAGGRP